MIFDLYIPSFPLSQFVENMVYLEGFQPEHAIDRFLPDGNIEFIIDLTGFPKYIFDNDTLTIRQTCTKAWISGVRSDFISIDSGKDARMLIIRFQKGRAAPFLKMPLTEISDQVIDGDLIFGNRLLELRDQLLNIESHTLKFKHVEAFLLKLGNLEPHDFACTSFALQQIICNSNQLVLKALYQKIGYSQKHFTHLFKKQVGTTPKSYLRIIRFQKAISELENCGQINWTQLSLDCGFYDQAHFINEFKRFSGFTPQEYLLRKNDMLNYIPVG